MLTEPTHFGGSLEDLRAVRAAVEHPVLRKDFLVDPDQILEARAAGADAVLLIAALPARRRARGAMLAAARALGMEPLVETHTDEDLDRVLATDAEVVGRERPRSRVARGRRARRARRDSRGSTPIGSRCWRAASATRADVAAAVAAGASAILVGETLMRAGDPGAVLRELIHGREAVHEHRRHAATRRARSVRSRTAGGTRPRS